MKVGSLFAGIGGFDLAAEWMGWRTAWFSEIDPYACRVLERRWPDVPNHGDIRKINGKEIEAVDIMVGGFPCQDISTAGKGIGIEGSRSGLWSEYARLIEEIRPRWIVAENVSALKTRGLDRVLKDLFKIGYDAEWHCIPASYIGAPHRRDRIWIVAYPRYGSWGNVGSLKERRESSEERSANNSALSRSGEQPRDVANTNSEWQQQPQGNIQEGRGRISDGGQTVADSTSISESEQGYEAEALSSRGDSRLVLSGSGPRFLIREPSKELADPIGERLEGHAGDGYNGPRGPQEERSTSPQGVSDTPSVSDANSGRLEGASSEGQGAGNAFWGSRESGRWPDEWWVTEPNVGRVAHGIPSRVDRLKCLGNAIVPQVAYYIFKAIEQKELEND